MGLHAEGHVEGLGLLGHAGQELEAALEVVFVVALAAGTDVDHGDPDLGARFKGLHEAVFVEGRHLHGGERQLQILDDGLDVRGLVFPVVEFQVLAHALDRGDLRRIVARPLDVLKCGAQVESGEEDGVHPQLDHRRHFPPVTA